MLIIGLGNPGSEYEATRHNAGFMALDILAYKYGFSFKDHSKFEGEIANITFEGKKIFFLKPQTFMNLSGASVSKVKNYYKIDISEIVALHDELDIDCGELRYKIGGGSAGHNGIKSLDSNIGKDYHRVRIGIGKPERQDVSDYVLKNFSKDQKVLIEESIHLITRNFDYILRGEFEDFKKNLR